jgi:hypothetical protein
VILTLLTALVFPETLLYLAEHDWGVTSEGPLDRFTESILLVGAYLSIVAFMLVLRKTGRIDWFCLTYAVFLVLNFLEETDWLTWIIGGLPARTLGSTKIGSLHDFLRKDQGIVRPEYPLALSVLGLLLVAVVLFTPTFQAIWRRSCLFDAGTMRLAGLGILLAWLGLMADVGYLPSSALFGLNKALLEEPLETIGALCLTLVAAEAACRAVVWRAVELEPRDTVIIQL